MEPIKFKEHNLVLAENQPEYSPLPVLMDNKYCVSCWKLSDEEIEMLTYTRKIWHAQMNFKTPPMPVFMTVNKEELIESDEPIEIEIPSRRETVIFHRSEIVFSFLEKIQLLFSKKFVYRAEIKVNKFVEVIPENKSAETFIESILTKHKPDMQADFRIEGKPKKD